MTYARRWLLGCLAVAAIACGEDGEMDPMADASVGEGSANLMGAVTRSAMAPDGADGDVYIAVFDRDPVLAMDEAVSVGSGFLEDADLSADDARVDYAIADIPVRAEPYFLIAFMDANDNVDASDMSSAGPDSGDLLSLRGLASISVTLDAPGEHMLDIDLNSVLP